MAVGAGGVTDKNDEAWLAPPEQQVRWTMHHQLEDSDTDVIHIKANYIANEMEWSTKRIGQAIARLQAGDNELTISRWTAPSTNPIVWEVRR
jgi:hypothetical protein